MSTPPRRWSLLALLIVLPGLSACDKRPVVGGPAPAASPKADRLPTAAQASVDGHSPIAAPDSTKPPASQVVDQEPAIPAGAESPKPMQPNSAQISEERELEQARERQAKLAQAQQQIVAGRLDDAQQSLRDVLTRGPTDEQRAAAQSLTTELERIRQARRQLKSWLAMLSSPEQREVETAQSQLLQDPNTAAGMLLEALRGTLDESQAQTYLTTLRQLDRPEVVVPPLLELLDDSSRKSLWPLITGQLSDLAGDAAGPVLLKLAVQATEERQQLAALEALAVAATPPHEAIFVLIPRLGAASPEVQLRMLRVVARAASVHDLHDWETQRNWPSSLTPDTIAVLQGFPKWLDERAKSPPDSALATEATRLRVMLGRELGQPVSGVKVARAEAETPESPAAALVDGVWNSVDAKTMWRHPLDRRGAVLLDLGSSRQVTAVRIWNWNELNGGQRGWKEVEVFVSDNPAELEPVAIRTLWPAPGVAEAADFSCLVPLPAPTGRYVRLQAKSTWTNDSHSGLAEVQVLAVP